MQPRGTGSFSTGFWIALCRGDQDAVFIAKHRQHPTVESAIDNLEHRPDPRLGSRWLFPRGGVSIVAFNIHRIGLLPRRLTALS